MNIIENPSLQKEVFESMGKFMTASWLMNEENTSDFVVLETIIESATYFLPMKNTKETVAFK